MRSLTARGVPERDWGLDVVGVTKRGLGMESRTCDRMARAGRDGTSGRGMLGGGAVGDGTPLSFRSRRGLVEEEEQCNQMISTEKQTTRSKDRHAR